MCFCKVVKYTVEADTRRKRSPRVRFQDRPNDTFTGSLSLLSSRSNCQTLQLNVVVWFQLFCRVNMPQHPCVTNRFNPSMSNHFTVSSHGQIETCGFYSERVLKRTNAPIQAVLAESGLLSNSEPWSETLWKNWGSDNSKIIQPEKMWWWFHSVTQCFLFLQINFQKECGSDNKCSSNLQMSAQFVYENSEPYPR